MPNILNVCEVFWMVFCPQAQPPRRKHETEEAAWEEAERLTRENPTKEFYVLKSVGKPVFEVSPLRRLRSI